MTLPPEKIVEIKQIIHNHLSRVDVKSLISNIVDDTSIPKNDSSRDIIFQRLYNHSIVDDIMKQVHSSSLAKTQGQSAERVETSRFLFLKILGGKAFIEHLQESSMHAVFILHVHFRGQRYFSQSTPCKCEPCFKEIFVFEFMTKEANSIVEPSSLLSLRDPIHMVLLKIDSRGENSLLSSHYLEWRLVLSAAESKVSLAVELLGVGIESKVPQGLLDIQLEISPPLSEVLSENIVGAQINLERSQTVEQERLFLIYVKQWWKEYLQIRPAHSKRLIKIFAQDENTINRPVCAYVQPLKISRLLDTPRQAARFISLIGYDTTLSLGGGIRQEQWCSLLAFLARSKGDCENHAVLLCSLLLGFGLDAYVCIGSKSKNVPHAWVMTRGFDGLITFWESLTATRYDHPTIESETLEKLAHPYKTIGCVFNHCTLFANCQPTDIVDVCSFNLLDESKWKCLSQSSIVSICGSTSYNWSRLDILRVSDIDAVLASDNLENQMKTLISDYRQNLGLSALWDSNLAYILTPALAAYELEKSAGLSVGNEEFQQAVHRAVPEGHTFKAYPIQFNHQNAKMAFISALKSPICAEIVCCQGDQVRLAVRVRIFPYLENAYATWIVFAVTYKCIL